MTTIKSKVEDIINDNAVAVFSKSTCSFCKATKELLNSLGADYYALEIDADDNGAAIQDALQEITGQRTVPNIFIGQKHIGGNSDLQGKKEELPGLLSAVSAIQT